MEIQEIVNNWFKKWEMGDFKNLPISNNFKHTSPYGTIDGKKEYTALVEVNIDKFLGHKFEIHDEMYDKDKACIRYTAFKDNFSLEVSEWYSIKNGLIEEVISYYNIEGEISEERKLTNPK